MRDRDMVMTGTLLLMLGTAARRDITERPACRFVTWGSAKKKAWFKEQLTLSKLNPLLTLEHPPNGGPIAGMLSGSEVVSVFPLQLDSRKGGRVQLP